MEEETPVGQKLRESKRRTSSYVIWERSPEHPVHEYDFSDDEKHHRHRRRHHHRHHRSHRHVRSDRHDRDTRNTHHARHTEMEDESTKRFYPEELGEVIGPLPPSNVADEHAYGARLLPGEGKTMAAYIKQGKRIPRRGEIGIDAEKIEALERAGFVMSGSRHERMNAVRSRKESQVLTVEDRMKELRQRAEDRARKESQIIEQFREMAGVQHQASAE